MYYYAALTDVYQDGIISGRWNRDAFKTARQIASSSCNAHPRAAIILDFCIPHATRVVVDVSSNRRSYRAKLLSAALTYSCTLARAKLLQKAGAYNGTDQRSLRPKLIRLVYYARKIAQFEYVCGRVCVYMCTERWQRAALSET